MSPLLTPSRATDWICLGASLCLLSLVVVAAGQPMLTDDIWIHLTLGGAYLEEGPWLGEDPLLANALGPPLPAAWFTDAFFFLVLQAAGFQGLRVVHVLLVLAIAGLAASILRRASGSWLAAGLGLSTFLVFSTYRLIQLRPHLFSLLAVLLLYRLLFEHRRPPGAKEIVASVTLLAVWANLHAAFVLGPLLIAAGIGGIALASLTRGAADREHAWKRIRPIGVVLVLGTLATLLNPSGYEPHIAYWIAGSETPTLTRVADEWAPVHLFSLPTPLLPPSPLAFGLLWGLWVVTPILGIRALLPTRTRAELTHGKKEGIDPAVVAMAVAGLCAPLIAVRFMWLGILPLVVCAQASRGWLETPTKMRASHRGLLALCSSALLLGFIHAGPWPMISAILPGTWSGYAAPYPAAKYTAHSVWILDDAEVEGTLFSEYFAGGFVGFWLAPEIHTFVNGTLNVTPETIAANRRLLERRGERPGESFSDLLDRHEIDFFVGNRLPRERPTNRPRYYTTAHLERTEGWIPIFRNLAGAVYMRAVPENAKNLERIVRYYRRQGVPFNREVGFEIERVISARLDWAIGHGVVPIFFDDLVGQASDGNKNARTHLASLFATLGLYERAIDLDRELLEDNTDDIAARRRLTWSLLRRGDATEAAEISAGLEGLEDRLSRTILLAARAEAEGELAPGQVHVLPVFTVNEARNLSAGVVLPSARTNRRDRSPGTSRR